MIVNTMQASNCRYGYELVRLQYTLQIMHSRII